MKKKITLLLAFSIILSASIFGQGETSNWYFGNNAGIRFNNNGTVTALDDGNYEYSLDGLSYTVSNYFENVSPGSDTVFVRDKNGCGITQETVEQDLTVEGFPKFFTPNGDGINDFWQFIPLVNTGNANLNSIFIFNRFGLLLAQIEPTSQGWNGEFNGSPVPASDYWFKEITRDSKELKGHFTLKR